LGLGGKMSHKEDYLSEEEMKIKLKINGKKIPLVPFIHNAMRDSIIGLVKNLKGFEKGKIEIEID